MNKRIIRIIITAWYIFMYDIREQNIIIAMKGLKLYIIREIKK
jgi:hypothetical protein